MWARALYIVETEGITLDTGIQAIIDALGIRTRTSLEYRDWGFSFLIWHSSYFSILTWISIFLMQAPRPQEISGKRNAKLTLITLALITIALISLITIIGLPADIDEIIILLVLGGLFLVPIAYFIVKEIKGVKLETKE